MYFIHESSLKAKEQGVTIEKYLDVMEIAIVESLKKANSISVISLTIMILLFLFGRLTKVPQQYVTITTIILVFIIFATMVFVYTPASTMADKLRAKKNLIKEAKEELLKKDNS